MLVEERISTKSPACLKIMVQVEEPQDYVDVLASHRGGFSFENCKRNAYLAAQAGIKPPTAMKSGTTICGIVVKDAVILAADTRATNGPMVADKNCEKLHYIAKNIFCAGAGTAADLQHTTEMMESQIELLRMATGTQPRVCTVVKRLSSMLFKYQGYIGCALVLGGFDVTGPHLYQIYPHGSTDKLPFTTMGSLDVLWDSFTFPFSPFKGNLFIKNCAKGLKAPRR